MEEKQTIKDKIVYGVVIAVFVIICAFSVLAFGINIIHFFEPKRPKGLEQNPYSEALYESGYLIRDDEVEADDLELASLFFDNIDDEGYFFELLFERYTIEDIIFAKYGSWTDFYEANDIFDFETFMEDLEYEGATKDIATIKEILKRHGY